MAKEKILIERNLKFNQKYIYLSITRGKLIDAQFTYCDNCGKLITNMVHVVGRNTKVKYTIGTDCAETLAKAKCLFNNSNDFYQDVYVLNKVERFATELRKGKKYEFNGIFCTVKTDTGKDIDCAFHDLKEFYPELIQP